MEGTVPELWFTAPGTVVARDATPARLTLGLGAVVRPVAGTTCDMDPIALSGLVRFRPAPLGHEAVAVVVDVGDHVTSVRPGDRVVVPWQISCGTCIRCVLEQDACCLSVPAGACYGWGRMWAPTAGC